jgi:hypothetical protein
LTYRKRFGDPLQKKAPLIREQFDINDKFAAAYPKPMSYRAIIYIVEEVLKRSGVKTKEVMRAHGFRKFAITMMIKAKVDYDAREYLVGHRGSRGLDANYDRTSAEDRLAEYLKSVDLLTINEENRLKAKVNELNRNHQEMMLIKVKHEQEMKTLREEMENQFNKIMSVIQLNPKLAHVKPEALSKKML